MKHYLDGGTTFTLDGMEQELRVTLLNEEEQAQYERMQREQGVEVIKLVYTEPVTFEIDAVEMSDEAALYLKLATEEGLRIDGDAWVMGVCTGKIKILEADESGHGRVDIDMAWLTEQYQKTREA